MENLSEISEKIYCQFMNDDSIIGFEGLLKSNGFGSKRRVHIRNFIYEKYGKDKLIHIYRSRLAKSAHKNRTPESYYISPERREKMIEGVKKSWENAGDERRNKSRKLMEKYCFPKSHTPEANKNRVNSRRGYKHSSQTIEKIRKSLCGRALSETHKKALRVKKSRSGSIGLKRSDSTKKKLSFITKKQWQDGVHVPTYKSKGQIEVASILRNSGYTIKEEFFVDGRPYDIFLKEKNTLIEFNGTFWHRDPRFYVLDDVCQKIWNNDKLKIKTAKNNGYNIVTIWQYDWENTINKQSFLESIIDGTKQ